MWGMELGRRRLLRFFGKVFLRNAWLRKCNCVASLGEQRIWLGVGILTEVFRTAIAAVPALFVVTWKDLLPMPTVRPPALFYHHQLMIPNVDGNRGGWEAFRGVISSTRLNSLRKEARTYPKWSTWKFHTVTRIQYLLQYWSITHHG